MRLLDLVEQDDAVRRASDALGEHASFAVAHVACGRSLEAGNRVRFLVFGHVDRQDATAEEHVGDGMRGFGLADAGRPAEHERADRPAAVREPCQVGARLRGAAGQRLILADHAPGQRLLDVACGLAGVGQEAADGHAGQVGDDGGDVVLGDGDIGFGIRGVCRRVRLVVAVAAFHSRPRTGRIQHHHGLVRQLATDDVASRKVNGCIEHVVAKRHRMVLGQTGRDALEYLQRLLVVRLLKAHRRHAARQSRIGLDVPPPFAPAASAENAHGPIAQDAAQRIRAAALVAEQEVDVVDVQQQPQVFDFLDDRLQAFLEGAANGRTGTQRRDVQRPHRGVAQRRRDAVGAFRDRADEA